MTSATTTQPVSGDDLLAMSDRGSCELIDGRIVPMNPPGAEHGRIMALLGWHLFSFVQAQQHAWVLSGDTGLYIRRNPDTVRGMDLAVISKQRLPQVPTVGYLDIAPELVAEIVSPSDRWQEIEDKLRDYFSVGVDQVWLVHPRQQSIYVYHSRSAREVLDHPATLHGTGILSGFHLPVAVLF